MPRKKGSGRTKGAVSFVVVSLGELNRILKEGANVVVSRRYAEQVGLSGTPMSANAKNIAAFGEQIEVKETNLEAEESVELQVQDWQLTRPEPYSIIETMKSTTEELFPHVVGQEQAKKRLGFYLDGFRPTGVCPHLLFVAPKGCGKTLMARAMGKQLLSREKPDKPKKFLEINCSTLKSVKQFFNQIVIPHINYNECTILFDEASELPKDLSMALLTILNPNKENRTSFSYEDYTVDFDFSRQTFMFATTEAQHIFHALMDRCERVDLEEYTYGQLAEIIGRVMEGHTFEEGVLEEIATVLRGNARQAQKMANNMSSYLASKNRKNFTKADCEQLKDALSILPLGLSVIELQILQILKEKKESSLTRLSAKTGLTKGCLQRDFEIYLQKHDLMTISTNGRELTRKGQEYLKDYDEAQAA